MNNLSNKTKDALFNLSILIIPLVCFALFYLYINASSFVMSFHDIDLAGKWTYVGLNNFKVFFDQVLNNGMMGLYITNSLKYYFITLFISLPLYLIFSFYCYKKFFGNRIFLIVVMLPQIIATFLFALMYKRFVEALPEIMRLQGIKNFPQLIGDERYAFGNNIFFTIWMSFGTSCLVYSNAMNGIDNEVIESSVIDGASNFRQLISIIIPLIWPTLTTFIVTGVGGMLTASGSLMVFYMYEAPPKIWGLGYYFTVTVKSTGGVGMTNYPMVATSGMVVTLVTAPLVFIVKYFMNKADRTGD